MDLIAASAEFDSPIDLFGMKSAYCIIRPDVPHLQILYPNLGQIKRGDRILFLDKAFDCLKEPLVNIVDRPEEADFFLIPHAYAAVKNDRAYLNEYAELSAKHGKKIVVINYGDAPAPVDLPNASVFVSSAYTYSLRPNEIMMPAYAEDLQGDMPFVPRPKTPEPVVGFCGWSDYKNAKNFFGTMIGNAMVNLRAFFAWDSRIRSERKGLTFRRAALRALENQPGIRTNFLIRRSYSGHANTISLPPEQARTEYVDNMRTCDLALAVKGDGNYSYRFYEALSLGRILLFIDTETPLPLEGVVDYGSFLLNVDASDTKDLAAVVREWWKGTPPEEIERMQRDARDAFARYLRTDRFFAYAFEHLL